jgi:hypothetical protein
VVINFLVTSAINDSERRLQELLKTIESIWRRIPLSHIHLTETSRQKPSDALLEAIPKRVNLYGFWGAEWINQAHAQNLPIAFLQNAVEIKTLQLMMDENFWYPNTYKISGRYMLTDQFSPLNHDQDRFVFVHPRRTGFSMQQVGTDGMLMTRLFGIPQHRNQELKSVLEKIEKEHWHRWLSGNPYDIEHGLYAHIDKTHCQFVDKIGVRGRIGHLEAIVED